MIEPASVQPTPVNPSRKPIVWGLLVCSIGAALIAPLLGLVVVGAVTDSLTVDEASILAQVIGNWTCVAVILLIVLRAERRPLSSMGFVRPRWRDLGLGAAGWIVALITTGILAARFSDVDTEPIDQLLALPLWMRALLLVTAGFSEEILFRGYALTRLELLTKRTWVAVVITCAFFVLLHAPFYGLTESLLRIPVTIVLTLVFLRTRSLWTVFVMHLLFDLPLVFVDSLPSALASA